jgi:hypothetical protein
MMRGCGAPSTGASGWMGNMRSRSFADAPQRDNVAASALFPRHLWQRSPYTQS